MRVFCYTQIKNVIIKRKIEFSFFCRNLSKCTEQETYKTKDPFKRKSRIPFPLESDSRNASRICMTIFGNAGIGQPRCIGLFTEFKGYLFNCGENVGRYCREYVVNTCLIKHVFITQRKWENISGLSDIYISNQTAGVYCMFLYGPPGVESVLSMMSSKVMDTQLIKKKGGYIDHTVKIDPIPISSEMKTISSYNTNRNFQVEQSGVVYSYVCKIHEKPGDFLTEKCVEKGVSLGPDLLKLKNWEDIILPSGNTVYAKDVHGPTYPERILLIVDCPSDSFIKPFIQDNKLKEFQSPFHVSSPVAVFHFTPSHIFKTQDYQDWMNRFPEGTQHFILNSDNSTLGSNVVHQIEKHFNLLHPKIFGKLREKELAPTQFCSPNTITDSKCIYLPPMMQIHLRPKEEFDWGNVVKDHDNINVTLDGEDIINQSPEFYEKLKDLNSVLLKKSLLNVSMNLYPEVVFLGTSSSVSTAYRNVTSILVNTSPSQSILLDCGEGSMMQLVRYFGHDVYSALQKISCIFISHKHLDHYLGVFEIISQRIKAFEKANIRYKPVVVILPFEVQDIFMKFCEVFQNLHPAVRLFRCKYLSNKKHLIKKFVDNLELNIVPVKHCYDAWGIVLESVSDWKIVYSGDSAPCQSLIDAGKDCTLLIHEASIEDGMVNEALTKKHSTPSQVLDIAERMNAQYTILTHFSKRYKGFPVLPDCNKEITCAFDFMRVRRCDLPLLPLFTPVIKCLFQEQLDSYEEKFSFRIDFENAFMKILKS